MILIFFAFLYFDYYWVIRIYQSSNPKCFEWLIVVNNYYDLQGYSGQLDPRYKDTIVDNLLYLSAQSSQSLQKPT